jgi:hypothetical protein
MQTEPMEFVHVLLFQCISCGLPVVNAVKTESKNLEEIDLAFHRIACECGWSGKASGLESKRHWVESWNRTAARDQRPD